MLYFSINMFLLHQASFLHWNFCFYYIKLGFCIFRIENFPIRIKNFLIQCHTFQLIYFYYIKLVFCIENFCFYYIKLGFCIYFFDFTEITHNFLIRIKNFPIRIENFLIQCHIKKLVRFYYINLFFALKFSNSMSY